MVYLVAITSTKAMPVSHVEVSGSEASEEDFRILKVRADYYLYNGDVSSVRVDKFKALYDLQPDAATANYNLDVL